MSNIGLYENRIDEPCWKIAENELEYHGQALNIGWQCSDRICLNGNADKVALIYEGFCGQTCRYTFNEIRLFSNTFAHYLFDHGIKAGDRICIFMDRIPDLYISFLGILKTGAIVQPLFSAFGEESLFVRLHDAQTKVIVTQKKYLSRIRKIKEKLPCIDLIIVVDTDSNTILKEKEAAFNIKNTPLVEEITITNTTADSPSVLQYTSGTTGQPKGALHTHNSIFSQYMTAKWVLDLKDNDIYWCTADPGWITGTSYGIIGPWSLGITQCILDCGFSAENWYRFIEANQITVWYTAPTAIRSLMKAGENIVKKHDLSCLRHLASVGEPLNAEAVIWGINNFGRPFHDTYWQTETGSIMISNYPGMKIKPGSMGKPFPGIIGTVIDTVNFNPINETGKIGLIAFKPRWPALIKTYWNNDSKYYEKFINGWYITGDKASIDADGYFWFVGRDDDVINTGGHLVSPFEVESALLEHPAVAESAVVSKPDDINMEVVKAFISLKPGIVAGSDMELEIMNFIRKKLSSIAMPQEIEFTDHLPRTRSGKIMRRILRAKEWNEDIGDISTLDND
jgi:acetyl-CoA synthetase